MLIQDLVKSRETVLKVFTKPNHTVIAVNRDPSHPTSDALADLPKAEGTTLEIIKLYALSQTDPAAAVKALAAKGITHIDILVANAGIALSWPKVSEVKVKETQKHTDVNLYGFIHLYQAFRPVLKEAQAPKLVPIGSGSAFLMFSRNFIPMQIAAYAPTKLALHWYTKAISAENPWLNAFPLDTGWVQTELGNRGANSFGVEKAAITVEESASGVVKVIDASTLQTHKLKAFRV
ncbi:hypothetical protein PDIDSM_191 [Penicillium digitatum]|nr:hypothetical protein PDIDSM_191 [Penicillium digitatum]